jgi:hypothetical protein
MAAGLLDKMIYVCNYLMLTTYEDFNGRENSTNALYGYLNFCLPIRYLIM